MARRPDSPIPDFAELIDRMNFLSEPPIPRRAPDRAGWVPAPEWGNDAPEYKRAPAYPEPVPQLPVPNQRREYDAQANGMRQHDPRIPIDPAILHNEPPSRRRDNGQGAYIQYPGLQIHVEKRQDQPQGSEPSTLRPPSQGTSTENGVPVIGPTLQAVIDVGQGAQTQRQALRRKRGAAPLRVVDAGGGDQYSEDHDYAPRAPPTGVYVPYRPPQEPASSRPPELPRAWIPPAAAYPGKPPLRGRAPQSEPKDKQTPALPPLFQHQMINYIQRRKHDPKALQWYLDDMTASDARGGAGEHDYQDLETILRSNARINLSGRRVPGRWRPVRHLGSGGYGSVVLWEREVEGKGETLRVACKYGRLDHWFQDYCHEGQIARKLISVGCTNVVKALDWAAKPDAQDNEQMKIIMEFCPYGDLYDLIHWYQRRRILLPEFFVWHILLSVATALCYCARGSLEEKPRDDWHPIFHRDLKPLNILLSEPTGDIKAYPTLKLADFGLAYTIPNDSVRRMKRRMNSGGTRGYIAPEAKVDIRSDPNQAFDAYAGPKSDIYSLGVMMVEILRMPKVLFPKGDAAWRLLDLQHDYSYNYYPYGKRLVWLARKCSRNDARERPDPLELYKEARKGYRDAWVKFSDEAKNTKVVPGENPTAGTVLYTPELQYTWDNYSEFRRRYRRHNDWFYKHRTEMLRLSAAVEEPVLAPRGFACIGNGLGPTVPVKELEGHTKPLKLQTEREYQYVAEHKHHPLTNIWHDQLLVEPLNEKWKKPGTKGTTAKKVQHEIDALLFGSDLPEVMKAALREGQNRREVKRATLHRRLPPLPSDEIVGHERELEEEAGNDLRIFKEMANQNRKAKGLKADSEATAVMDTASKMSSALAGFFGRGPQGVPVKADDDAGWNVRRVPSVTAHLDAALAAAGMRADGDEPLTPVKGGRNGNGKRKREQIVPDDADIEDPRIKEFWDKRRKKYQARQETNAAEDAMRGGGNSSYERKRQNLQARRLQERALQRESQKREKKTKPRGGIFTGLGVLDRFRKFQDQL